MPYESHHHHHHRHHHDCHGSRGRGGNHGGFRPKDFHPDGFRPDFHSDHHPDFRPGIPGDYFEQVEGTYVEPPFARRRDDDMPVIPLYDADGFPSPDGESMGETLGTVDGGASPLGASCEAAGALRCLRLACKALSDVTTVVANQRGIDVYVSFLPPYCGEPCLSPMEWAVLVDGDMVFYGSYDKLREIWLEGPDAMYEHLCSVIDTADAMGTIVTTLGDIIACHGNDGDDGDGSGHDDDMPSQDQTVWVPDVDLGFVSSVLDACGLGGDDEDCDGDVDDDRGDNGHHHHDGHRHDGHRHDGHPHGDHHGYHGHRGGHHHGHHGGHRRHW